MTNYHESTTVQKVGWGRAPYRRVKGLTSDERDAIERGVTVWFRFTPWHYMQSGYKVVTYHGGRYDSREPTPAELEVLERISNAIKVDEFLIDEFLYELCEDCHGDTKHHAAFWSEGARDSDFGQHRVVACIEASRGNNVCKIDECGEHPGTVHWSL